VVVHVHHLAMDHVFQFLEVDDKARNGVYFTLYGHFQGVVVTMTVPIRALPEKAKVFLR
jgi:hypothetical protein